MLFILTQSLESEICTCIHSPLFTPKSSQYSLGVADSTLWIQGWIWNQGLASGIWVMVIGSGVGI